MIFPAPFCYDNRDERGVAACVPVFAAVAGQVVISQADVAGRFWLAAGAAGNLMTTLAEPGRGKPPLLSGFSITDGRRHRLGLTWDGSRRRLYADGAVVKADEAPLSGLAGSSGGLYFGAANILEAGASLEGFIEALRLYNRALRPQQAAALAE